MRTILAVVVMVFCVGADEKGCTGESQEHVERRRCISDCQSYGASMIRMKVIQGVNYSESYECWCRRGAESGSGSEPLRIW